MTITCWPVRARAPFRALTSAPGDPTSRPRCTSGVGAGLHGHRQEQDQAQRGQRDGVPLPVQVSPAISKRSGKSSKNYQTVFQAMKKGGTPILPHFGPKFRILTSVFSGPFFDDFPTYPISTVKQYWQLMFGQGSSISKLKLPVLYS